MKKRVLMLGLTVVLACSACTKKNETVNTDVATSSEITEGESASTEETSETDEKVLNHSVFKDYDEEKDAEETMGDEFNYAYDWKIEYENDDLEGAFIDYLYYLSGFYPAYAELVGDGAVNEKYAVWEGKGYNIGTIISDDGASAKIYIQFTDKTLKSKLDDIKKEKDKQAEEIAKKRNDKYNTFKEEIAQLENLDSIPSIIKNYPLYADCIITYGKLSDDASNSDYSTKNMNDEQLSSLIDILLKGEYTNIEEAELDEELKEESVDSMMSFELLNDCNNEELVNSPTSLGYIVYFKDSTVNYYLDTLDDNGEYKVCRVSSEGLKEFLDPIHTDMVKRAEENKEQEVENIEE